MPWDASLIGTPSFSFSLSLRRMFKPSTEDKACLTSKGTSDAFVPLPSSEFSLGLDAAGCVIFRTTVLFCIGKFTTFINLVVSAPPLLNM